MRFLGVNILLLFAIVVAVRLSAMQSIPPGTELSGISSDISIEYLHWMQERSPNLSELESNSDFQKAQSNIILTNSAVYGETWLRIWWQSDTLQSNGASFLVYQWAGDSEVYTLNPDGKTWRSIASQLISYWGFARKVVVEETSAQPIYLKLQHGDSLAHQVSVYQYNQESFELHSFRMQAILGALYGIFLAMLFYNAFLSISLRSAGHVIYVLYGSVLFCYVESQVGYLASLFNWNPMSAQLAYSIAVLAAWGFIFFVSHFLKLTQYMPRIGWIYLGLNSILALVFLSLFPVFPQIAIAGFNSLLIFSAPVHPGLAVITAFKGYRPAWALVIPVSLPVLGTFVFLLMIQGYLPLTEFSMLVQLSSFVAELILMSLALGYQLRLERAEMLHSINHAYQQLKKMVYPHQLRMIQEGARLEETLPSKKAHAAVISFDIIRSSQIERADKRYFFESVFSECNQSMMRGYSPDNPTALAYRIKEMGDGFLCSVGFPLELQSHDNVQSLAVALATDFMEIFARKEQEFANDWPIHAAIGVAYGDIEGFFPQSGTADYDLFGEAIVLADRYQSLRKLLFREIPEGNIITIQDRIYDGLGFEQRQKFSRYELNESHITRVRDDLQARCFYYSLFEVRKLQSSQSA